MENIAEGLGRRSSAKDAAEGLRRRTSAKDVAEGLGRKTSAKDVAEGLGRRTSAKDVAEGLGRSSSAKDSAEALDERLRRRRGNEGSKSVDFVINIDFHCKLFIFTFWTQKIQREIYRDYFLISYSSFSSLSS